ncbi:MAG: PAS domain S-box protein [Candidatus Sumerlaeia bacterium]|nr:PAS domain S-box protein [Candidatus Sumerlaeia bacterium]
MRDQPTNETDKPDSGDAVKRLRELEGRIKDLEERNARLEGSKKRIQKALRDIVFVLDKTGVYRDIHRSPHCPGLKIPREQFLGKHLCEVLPEDIREQRLKAFEQVVKTIKPQTVNYTVEDKGKLHWCSALLVPELDEQGDVSHVIMSVREVIRDEINEGKRVLSEGRFRQYVEAVGAIPWVYDIDSDTMTYIGPQVEEILGFTQEECMKPGFTTRQIHPDDREKVLEDFARLSSTKERFESEYRFLTKTGKPRWFRDIVTVEQTEGTRNITRGLMLDITEEKATREALKESEARFQRAVKGSAVGLWEVDLARQTIHVDPQVNSLLRYELNKEEIKSLSWWQERIHPEDLPFVVTAYHRHLKRGAAYRGDVRMRRGDGIWGWFHIRGEMIQNPELGSTHIAGSIDDITLRKNMEADLARREEILQRMSILAKVGWWNLDLKSNKVEWSDETYNISEVDQERELNRDFCLKFYPEEARKFVLEAVRKAIDEGAQWDIEVPYLTARETPKSVRMLGVPVYTNGELVKLEGIIQDVTDRREAVNALELRERILGAVAFATENFLLQPDFESAIDQVLQKIGLAINADLVSLCRDESLPDGGCLSTVRSSWRHVGSISDDFLKSGEQLLLAEIGLGRELELLREGKVWHGTAPQIDGAAREIMDHHGIRGIIQVPVMIWEGIWGHITILDCRQERQWPETVVEALRTVASTLAAAIIKRAAEMKLQESEENYRTIFSSIRDCMIIIDPETLKVLDANTAALDTYGYTREEFQSLPPAGWSAEPERTIERFRQSTPTDAPYLPMRTHKKKDGTTFPVEIVQSRFHLRGKLVLGSVIRDISERVAADKARQEIETRLQYSAKMESLGVLAGGIAHDFNNLLVGIMGSASLASTELQEDSPAHDAIKLIEKSARRAADLTRQMLAYSGRGRFVVEAVNLTHLVAEMAHLLEASISKKARLCFDYTESLPAIEGDLTQIRQIVMNLIMNASDSLEDRNGMIHIRTGTFETDEDYFRKTWVDDNQTPGPYVYLEISDTGIGMDRETLDRIFDPFYTTKNAGRGLGLAAVLGIVRGHKGFIKVYSEPGNGTTVRVGFPATAEEALREETPPSQPVLWKGTGTVLIIDDEPAIHKVLEIALSRAGFTTLNAHNGQEGLDVYKAHCKDISIVLLDMTMPIKSGDEVFREIRLLNKEVPVILMSGYSEVEATNKFTGKRLSGFIQKPFRPQEIIAKIREVVAR